MALAKVLALPELLEAILLRTDMVTLLTSAQRVNKYWHHTIESSVDLQKRLFFRDAPYDYGHAPTVHSAHVTNDGEPASGQAPAQASPELRKNPLLVNFFSPCFFEAHDKGYFRQAHSFFALRWTSNPRKEKLDAENIMRSIPFEPPEDAYIQPFRERFFRKNATWRRMLVTQPAVSHLGYIWSEEHRDGEFRNERRHTIVKGTTILLESGSSKHPGLRMGWLYDLVQERASHHDLQTLWFRMHWGAVASPMYCPASADIAYRVMRNTRIAVEFVTQDMLSAQGREPANPKVFDDFFRCDDHAPRDVDFDENALTLTYLWQRPCFWGNMDKYSAVYEGGFAAFNS